jgi:probable H4MPT-linked C1 transfer pathway protein
MTKINTTIGWDVGGAHLKAALIDGEGIALKVIQVPCKLWQGIDELHAAIELVMRTFDHTPDRHIVTMTGELADIFTDRIDGVVQISRAMTARLGGAATFFFAGQGLLISSDEVSFHAVQIASANWMASAVFVAKKIGNGLFLDIGSTTTDVLLLRDGKPQNRGFSDAERLQFDELIYTGVTRTPLMALGPRMPLDGHWYSLAAEHFATTSDVYRLTGDLDNEEDMADTADSKGKTLSGSARRIARMMGQDSKDAPIAAWIGLSMAFKQKQLDVIESSVRCSLSRLLIDDDAPVIGAGTGSFLAQELARRLQRDYIDVQTLILSDNPETARWASVCLPAYAVACLDAVARIDASA